MELRSNAPSGDIETAWDRHRFDMKLVNPANKRKFNVIVVGTGLAGASASATMAELGYKVKVLQEGCRGLDLSPGDVQKALKEMEAAGAQLA